MSAIGRLKYPRLFRAIDCSLLAVGIGYCDECERRFLTGDDRANLAEKWGECTYCPLCAYRIFRGSEAWAVWNSCQGVFCDSIAWSKDEAAAMLVERRFEGDPDAKVVPVRVYEEPAERVHFREWLEEHGK